MSNLFSRLWQKVVTTFSAAEAEVDKVQAALAAIPGVKQLEDIDASAIKQQVSNALAFAGTEIGAMAPDVVSMAESAVDTWVMGITHGVAAPAIPGLNALMTMGEEHLVAVIRAQFADARVKLNLPAPTSEAAPTLAGVISSVVSTAGSINITTGQANGPGIAAGVVVPQQ